MVPIHRRLEACSTNQPLCHSPKRLMVFTPDSVDQSLNSFSKEALFSPEVQRNSSLDAYSILDIQSLFSSRTLNRFSTLRRHSEISSSLSRSAFALALSRLKYLSRSPM